MMTLTALKGYEKKMIQHLSEVVCPLCHTIGFLPSSISLPYREGVVCLDFTSTMVDDIEKESKK